MASVLPRFQFMVKPEAWNTEEKSETEIENFLIKSVALFAHKYKASSLTKVASENVQFRPPCV
eukprot:12402101-Karenia_brevis.AAC.1